MALPRCCRRPPGFAGFGSKSVDSFGGPVHRTDDRAEISAIPSRIVKVGRRPRIALAAQLKTLCRQVADCARVVVGRSQTMIVSKPFPSKAHHDHGSWFLFGSRRMDVEVVLPPGTGEASFFPRSDGPAARRRIDVILRADDEFPVGGRDGRRYNWLTALLWPEGRRAHWRA